MQRKAAAQLGLSTYQVEKPCRRGHFSPRYTSTGGCMECLKTERLKIAAETRSRRVEKNSIHGQTVDVQLYSRVLPFEGHSLMDQVRGIIMRGTIDQFNRLVTLGNMIAAEIELAAPLVPRLSQYGRTLTHTDLVAMMAWDGKTSANWQTFALLDANPNDPMDDAPICIELGKHWYDVEHVGDCLRGNRRTVDPVLPTPAMMARYKSGTP